MSYSSLSVHDKYKALPAQAVEIKPDAGCAGCPLLQTEGHRSCSTFKLSNKPPVPTSARINLTNLRQMQGQLHMRAFVADGIPSSPGDPWYPYNASRQVNFAAFSLWTVTAVTGDSITMETTGDDARSVLYASWSETEQTLGYFRITGYYSVTSTQPGDILEFESPSKAHPLKAKVLQITAASSVSITVRIDKDLSSIYDSYYPVSDGEGGYIDDPEEVTARVYHYGRESERWTYIQEPHYFYGSRRQKEVTVAGLPGDGIWILEETALVCPPESFDPLNSANWTLEGFADGVWTIIHEDSRIYISHATGARVALKTTIPEGGVRDTPATDLTETYTKFRATYYIETTSDDVNCSIRGYDRCYYSRIDHSNSAGNYGATHGAGITADGKHIYCAQHVYPEYELIDEYDMVSKAPGEDGIPERVEVTLHHPTGLTNYPADSGKCVQYGYCNKHESTVGHQGDDEAPFNIDRTMRFLLQLWFACDKRRIQKYVLAEGATGYSIERIEIPSIMWLNGYYGGLTTAGGWHPQAYMRGDGTWSVKKPSTVVDQDGNETLMMAGGLQDGYLLEYDETSESMVVAEDVVANIPATVPDINYRRDPFNPDNNVLDFLLEYIGAQVERDTGQIKSRRGLSGISVALAPETIVAPGFDLGVHTLQHCDRATFIWSGNEEDDGILTILAYVQEDKPVSLGSRTIHSFSSAGTNLYKIELRNEPKEHSQFNLGDLGTFGDSYDEIKTVSAGGGPVILPFDRQGLSSYDGQKETGSRHAGLSPLDCIEIDGHRFIIKEVLPHGGGEESTWGSRIDTIKGEIGGFFELPVPSDGGELLLPLSDIAIYRNSDDEQWQLLSADSRPPISSEEVWFDNYRRLYFTSSDAYEYVRVTYKDSGGGSHTEYFTILPSFEVSTDKDYSDYTSAEATGITLDGVSATIIASGDPTPGQVKVTDDGGKIKLAFCIDDAPGTYKFTLTYDEDAAPPTDDWSVNRRYTEFGKKRDAIIVMADAYDSGDFFSGKDLSGEPGEFFRSSSVFIPKADLVVNKTTKTSDAWTAIPTNKRTPNAASGQIRIKGDYLATLSGVICFQLPDIQMVDNRGFVPASLLNKTQAVLDMTRWCFTSMSAGRGAYGHARRLQQYWFRGLIEGCIEQYIEDDVYETEWGGSGNYFFVGTGQFDSNVSAYSTVELSVEASSFGAPVAIELLPDGIEIEEAYAVVSCSGLTRNKYYERYPLRDCDDNLIDPGEVVTSTEVTDLSYTVIRYTSPSTYVVVGSMEGGKNGTKVVDMTAVAQDMYANRKSGHYGYGLIVTPADAEGASLDDLLPGEPDTRDRTVCPGNTCEGTTYAEYYTTETTSIHWTNASIGQVALKVDWKEKDKVNLVQPRFPAFSDAS